MLLMIAFVHALQTGATVTVCEAGCDATTVADGVALALPGDELFLDTEQVEGCAFIDKDLVVRGRGVGSTTIDVNFGCSNNFAFTVTAPIGLVIEDLSLAVTTLNLLQVNDNATVRVSRVEVAADVGRGVPGGALVHATVGNITLEEVHARNSQGAVAFVSGTASLTIRGSTFDSGVGANSGSNNAGVLVLQNASVLIADSLFIDNFAFESPAVRTETTGSVSIVRSRFSGNRADNRAGAIHVAAPNVVLTGNFFCTNDDDARAGAVVLEPTASATVRNNVFADNLSRFGDAGALDISGAAAIVEHNLFIGNRAPTNQTARPAALAHHRQRRAGARERVHRPPHGAGFDVA